MSSMPLFSMEDVQNLSLEFEFPDTSKNYVKYFIDEVPVGHLKIESLIERSDHFAEILKIIPQYVIQGKNIVIMFKEKSMSIEIDVFTIPPIMQKTVTIEEDKESIFTKDFLHKLSIDVTYLLGIIIPFMGIKNESVKISGRLRLKKEKKIDIDFSKIINVDNVHSIDENVKVTGVLLKSINDEEWSYYIRNVDEAVSITNWFKFNLLSSFDVYETIEKYILKLNEILLLV